MLPYGQSSVVLPNHGPDFQLIEGSVVFSQAEEEGPLTVQAHHLYTGEEIIKTSSHLVGGLIYPAVFYLEGMAQTACQAAQVRDEFKGMKTVFSAIKNAEFPAMAVPGEEIHYIVNLYPHNEKSGHCDCMARVSSKIAAKATIGYELVTDENFDRARLIFEKRASRKPKT